MELSGIYRSTQPYRPSHSAAYINPQTSAGALHNVINDSSSFTDTSSTALIASATFRLAVLKEDNSTYISNANAAYNFVRGNIDSDGWLRNTVDPLTFYTPSNSSEPSPEGQSFVLLLEAARRDFQDWVESEGTLPSGNMVVDRNLSYVCLFYTFSYTLSYALQSLFHHMFAV